MAWIRIIDEDEAEGSLERQYRAARKRAGKVFQILKVHSLDPPTLRASMALYMATTTSDSVPLSRVHREMIAVVVSRANECFY
jgi:alkylhydroperoxidase family enzyme